MVRRVASLALGIVLVSVVVYLGFQARNDQDFVVWFGLAAAILAPTGVASIGYTFRRDDGAVLRELSRVPEIEQLIKKAKTQGEKVRLLEQERSQLLATVQQEARKTALRNQKEQLEHQASRMLAELEAVDSELKLVSNREPSSPAAEAINELQSRLRAIRKGDLVIRFGNRYFTIDRELLLSLPMGGTLLLYLRALDRILLKK